jgi:DNA-binding NtrC family response regulator
MNVLVVDDEAVVRRSLSRHITRTWRDAHIESVGSLGEAERALDETPPDVATIDLGLPPDPLKLHGLQLVERMAKQGRADRAVVLTGRPEAVDAARRAGARIVLVKPIGHAELREAGRQLGIPLVGEPEAVEPALSPLVGTSRAMVDLRDAVRRLGKENGPVLVEGETGTGKELVARAIHGFHGRGPFHGLNCGALDTLAESQLFGHARGAFTSAERRTRGAIAQAGEGVLFLDEIGELAKSLQPKLLRLLEHPFQALGDERWIELRARVVAASHVDLEACVADGRFRDDLFYRLAVHIVRVPPIRERTEDIPALVHALLGRLTRPKHVTGDAIAVLAAQEWPGNVRQLAGFLERVAVHTDDDTIDADDVIAVQRASLGSSRRVLLAGPVKVQAAEPLRGFGVEMAAHERMLFERALSQTNGNIAAAARLLGVDRMVLTRWMHKQGRR